jgi:hypothetical protein
MNLNYVVIVKQDLDKLLTMGFITPVEATWLSPIVVVLKKNGKASNLKGVEINVIFIILSFCNH